MYTHTKNKPVYKQIYDFISEGIHTGKFGNLEKLPSDGQLMVRFGASRTTVVKAMQELKLKGLIDRRPGSGSYVRLNDKKSNKLVSMIVADVNDVEFFEYICSSIASNCYNNELSLLWGTDYSSIVTNEKCAIELCQRYIDMGVSGVFFAPCQLPGHNKLDMNSIITETLSSAGITVVLMDRDIVPFPIRSQFDLIGIDNYEAGFIQTQHLIERGCRRIIYASRHGTVGTMSGRYAGYRYALEMAGISFEKEWHQIGTATDIEFAKTILTHNPDGIACFHDPIAIELLNNFQKLNVCVPQKLKVIGLDDVKYSNYLTIPLSTLRQPCPKIGAQAVERMIRRLQGETGEPKQISFSATLIPRRSTDLV
ncbi:MAG: GntR family transcriptional regulator [Planctomycetia bacterium]|nr:GntR family transcriptional regulator [Planctomycetia bacterium]